MVQLTDILLYLLLPTAWSLKSKYLHDSNISTQPQVYRGKVGHSVRMECNVTNLGRNILLWKQGTRVLTAGSMKVRRDPRLHLVGTDLIIQNLELEDKGEYDCEVESDREVPISIRHSLDILYSPTVIPQPESGDVTVKEDSSIVLACTVDGNPTPTVIWSKDNQVLYKGASYPVYNINRFSAGEYTCTADNGVGMPASAVIAMKVLYPPVVKTNKQRVLGGVGHTVELSCSVLAQPQAEIRWFKNTNQELNPEPGVRSTRSNRTHQVLSIHRMSEVDFGEYTCEGRNSLGVGRTQIHVAGNPEKPVLDPHVERVGRGSYRIFWGSNSHSSITEYNLYYRRVQVHSTDWTSVHVQQASQATQGRTSLTLTGLIEDAMYQIQMDASNMFGKSDLSEVFTLQTHKEEYYSTVKPETYFSFFQTSCAVRAYVNTIVLFTLLL